MHIKVKPIEISTWLRSESKTILELTRGLFQPQHSESTTNYNQNDKPSYVCLPRFQCLISYHITKSTYYITVEYKIWGALSRVQVFLWSWNKSILHKNKKKLKSQQFININSVNSKITRKLPKCFEHFTKSRKGVKHKYSANI